VYLEYYEPGDGLYDRPGMPLADAYNVSVRRKINAAAVLTFNVPHNGPSRLRARRDAVIKCEGQLYIVKIVTDGADNGRPYAKAEARALWWDVCEKKHLPTVNYIGLTPADILADAFAGIEYLGNPVRLLSGPELNLLGLEPVTDATDILDADKMNPIAVLDRVMKNVGGELYVDNLSFALVKALGRDTGVRLGLDKNLKGVERTEDTARLVTRLYPYGRESLEISSVNGGVPYIDSPLIKAYPKIYDGFIDFRDYEDPVALLTRAMREFDADNFHRIDIPRMSYKCAAIDLWKLGMGERYDIGDYCVVIDSALGIDVRVRVAEYEYYPYEPQSGTIILGDPPKTVGEILAGLSGLKDYYYKSDIPEPVISDSVINDILKNEAFYTMIEEVAQYTVLAAGNIHSASAFITDAFVDRLWTNVLPFLCIPNLEPMGPVQEDGSREWDWAEDNNGDRKPNYSCVDPRDKRHYISAEEEELHFLETEFVPVEDRYSIPEDAVTQFLVGSVGNGKKAYWTSIADGDKPYTYITYTPPKDKYPNISDKNAEMFCVMIRKTDVEVVVDEITGEVTEYVKEHEMAGIEFMDAFTPGVMQPLLYWGRGDRDGHGRFYLYRGEEAAYLTYESPANGFLGLAFRADGVWYRHKESDELRLIGSGEGGGFLIRVMA